jgi:hypothetical protein
MAFSATSASRPQAQLQSGDRLMTKKLTDRQRFEKCVRRVGYDTSRVRSDNYDDEQTRELWILWQAALRSERRRKGK